jgi:glycosyltransferase involved in cell wall biosynthesis
MKPNGIFIFYHCESNTGYAIGRHEPDFFKMAKILTGDERKIHLGYSSLAGGIPSYVDKHFNNIIEFDSNDHNSNRLQSIHKYIRSNNIDVGFGFDQPVTRPAYPVMRRAGMKLLVSYWGAPISGINHGIILYLKKLEVKLRRNRPDHYIFQSKAMADSAIYGRGISPRHVTVIHNAVDTDKFKPDMSFVKYAHQVFNIPTNRKIVFYSGHMEERKGVRVIIEAANELIRLRGRRDVHFIFLGNIEREEEKFWPMYSGTETEDHITFGGYRADINHIHPSCYLGVIATTGWDSFTMSSMEIASSGLPLIVSNLQGLSETVEHGITGFLIEPGNHIDLADKIELLLDNPELQKKMGSAGRLRVIERFSLEKHIEMLVSTMQVLYSRCF